MRPGKRTSLGDGTRCLHFRLRPNHSPTGSVEKLGFKRAAVAVARKLAVIMHAMLKSGKMFNRAATA